VIDLCPSSITANVKGMVVSEPADRNARYAIYWAPPDDSVLARIGAAWLGRDAVTDRALPRPTVVGFDDATLAALTAEPRRYGLHATLKPPFGLATAATVSALEAALTEFAAATAPVVLPALQVSRIGNFVALVPAAPAPAVQALADACVAQFDAYRAPASDDEVARRNAAGLTPAQRANLRRWGYPYVMEEFRFHVTLTGPLEPATGNRLVPVLSALFAEVTAAPLAIDALALFVEPGRGQPFRLRRRFALGGR